MLVNGCGVLALDCWAEMDDYRAGIADFCPAILDFRPHHSREGGNPDGFSQALPPEIRHER